MGRVDCHIKMVVVFIVPLRVLSLKHFTAGVFAAPFRVLSQKKALPIDVLGTLELEPLRGEKEFKLYLQNNIFVPPLIFF